MTLVRMCIALAVIVLMAAAPVVAGPSAPAPQPQIHFPDQSHLFPPAIEGDTVSHDFVIENHGKGPLAITRVRTD